MPSFKHSYFSLLIYLCLTASLLSHACSGAKNHPFSRRDIIGAQRVLDLNFTRDEIDSMRTWLKRSHSGIQAMRHLSLENAELPRLLFSPEPRNYQYNSEQKPIFWPEEKAMPLPENLEELAFSPLTELGLLLKSRKLKSLDLTQMYIDRIHRYDDTLQAVITLTEELALQQAKKADRELDSGYYRGPLHGIPYGIKDLFAVPGYPTTWGAAPYQDQVFEEKAFIVQKLEEAGAVLIAKLSSGELANGDVWFGGKTKNPWDLSQGARGSSAGSGSATAAGLVAFAIGTETWGSIVSPATRCGITGLRPSYGRVSRTGGMTLSWTLDKVGPMCRSALDCALVFDVIRGKDPQDPSTVDKAFNFQPKRDLSKLSVAFLKSYFDENLEDSTAVGRNDAQALEVFRSLGMVLDSIDLPERFPASDMMSFTIRAEAGAAFEELVMQNKEDLLTRKTANSRANSLRISYFMPATSYVQAQRLRGQLIESVDSLFQQYDLILAPTFGNNQSAVTNLTGHPVISLPTGKDDKGRPTSMVLIGRLYEEATLLEAAYQFQERTDVDEEWPEWLR